jgi:acyl transferase domain-containing protein/acyl carrier protein
VLISPSSEARHPGSGRPGTGRPGEELRHWLRAELGRLLGTDPAGIRDDARFAGLGLDSLRTTQLAAELSAAIGEAVPPAVLWAYPCIDDLIAYLGQDPAERDAVREPPAAASAPGDPGAPAEPVAVVGMACRFPGANSTGEFWALLRDGTDAVGPVPADRWIPNPALAGRGVPAEAGFLTHPVYEFDPLFFSISPREAAEMDPQQRLFLEVAWEALQDAGLANGALERSRTGVFAGAIWHDHADLQGADIERLSQHSATGFALNMVANRVSYALGLRGPSMTLDSACSSSLLAIHLACQSLRSGESDVALAGGVNLLLSEATMVALTRFGGLSADGRCKAFDARADGFGRGEGCGVVVLKRLARALADGDQVCCVIRGSAANNDGPSNGLTAPSQLAQQDVLRQAYRQAGVSPADVHLVETHGTGTALGDPIEAAALGTVLGSGRAPEAPLVIGAVKSNLGHLEGAAGIAGLIKAALCVKHGAVPPNVHFSQPNPHIDFEALGLRVPAGLEPWPTDRERLAGVSSFGWGGTNVHVVLEGWAEPDPVSAVPAAPDPPPAAGTARPRVAFVCSPHGHQWIGMARMMLRTEPVFRDVMERCDQELARHTGWSLLDELFTGPHAVRYDDVSVTQPILFAIEIALAAWLEAKGAGPDAVVGHSLGEISAAVIAGFLDIPQAARLVHHYSGQQQRIGGNGGGMLVVELAEAELSELLPSAHGTEPPPVVIAGWNGPRSTVLAGDIPVLEQLLSRLKERGALCAMIRVNVAAHSAAIDAVVPDLIAGIGELSVAPGRIPMISTVTGEPVRADDLDAAYFARNLREPVRLADATARLVASGHDVLVELSANPVLLAALRQTAEAAGGATTVLGTMIKGDDDRAGPLDTLRALSELGAIEPPRSGAADPPELFTMSAVTAAALRASAGEAATAIGERPGAPVAELVAAANRRADHPHRLAVVARTSGELAAALREHAAGSPAAGSRASAPPAERAKVVFVFPGQGSQWPGMGRELLAREPVFHSAIRQCAAAASRYVDWSVLEELDRAGDESRPQGIDVVQPLLFAMEVALARLWESWGVRPDAVVGHSMGEAAAAYIAGAISLDDAARVICLRSRLMRRASGLGAMLATELTTADAARAIAGREDKVSVAVSNSRQSTVLSGDRDTLEAIAGELGRREVFCRWVKVDVASHSPQMDPLHGELSRLLDGVSSRAPRVPMHSTVTGGVVADAELDAAYWNRNLRLPVLFGDQVGNLMRDGHHAFIEISPHPILLPAIQQVAMDQGAAQVAALASLRRDRSARETMLDSLGALYVLGAPVSRARAATPARRAPLLPPYAWQRAEYRPEPGPGRSARPAGDSLLGERLDSAVEPGTHYWQPRLDLDTAAIGEHRVHGEAVLPAGAYADMALRAARDVLGPSRSAAATVTGLLLHRPLLAVPPERRIQVALTRGTTRGPGLLRVFDDDHASLADAVVSFAAQPDGPRPDGPRPDGPRPADVAVIEELLAGDAMPGDEWYARLGRAGLGCGPAYRRVRRLSRAGLETFAALAPAPGAQAGEDLRPRAAALDAAIQVATAPALLDDDADAAGLIGGGIARVTVYGPLDGPCYAHAALRPSGEAFTADVALYSLAGDPLAEATGVTLLRLDRPTPATPIAGRGEGGHDEPRAAGPIPGPARGSLPAAPSGAERRAAIEALTSECVASIARIPAAAIDRDMPLRSLGFDSLMVLELRNSLEARLGVSLSTQVVLDHPTLRALTSLVAESS